MKKKLLIIIAVAMIITCTVVAFAACGGNASVEAIQEKGVLSIATSANFPPFETTDESGAIIGWDIDIAHKLAEYMGVELNILNMDFDSVLAAVSSGRADIGMAGISNNASRDEVVDFSDNVFDSTQVIIVRNSDTSINGPMDLAGKTVGAQRGTVGQLLAQMSEDWAYDFLENGDPDLNSPILGKPKSEIGYETGAHAVEALVNGKLDAVILDRFPAEAITANYDGQVKILETPVFEDAYAFAVAEGNTGLAEWINEAIAKMKADGFWDSNMEKWFGSAEV